ncbi:hypothetical protein [Streptomyces guryensis]|uniref:DUF3592 domain-containing protein n=1 Tax=Streptomyces guryensis TaxID=2886947 RepID=A0A9Q3VRA5_9ACTN|nr:hypothetical protein [Streptomyces guryensis]MCD9876362.1 hypothetical protein [Streptomyces guryensis]
MAHLRTTVWGPAEFVGLPPRWLVAEGILAGGLASVAIVGTALYGAWTGRPSLADGEAGLVCAGALALYLSFVGAGRAPVAVAALLGACLALQAPQVAAGMVLAEREQVQSVVVTSVEDGRATDGGRARYLCSVADTDGIPLKVRIWRGCGRATRPGDALAVVYDPKGSVPTRGAETGAGVPGPLRDLAPWSAALVAGSVVAVVRSYRLSRPTA